MKAILVSVDYFDLLSLTLPWNRHHFDEVWVVTSVRDEATQRVAMAHGANLVLTDLFYADGAHFNKWRALEHGLDQMGRSGWICVMDADVCWPKAVNLTLKPGCLYTPERRNAPLLPEIPLEESWSRYPLHRNKEFAGWTQIFHADDPVLGKPPWYETDWTHAGGADSFFQRKWPGSHKIRPGFEVLHLGERGVNWCGRSSAFLDGTRPEDADQRRKTLFSLRKQIQRGSPDPYAAEKLR